MGTSGSLPSPALVPLRLLVVEVGALEGGIAESEPGV